MKMKNYKYLSDLLEFKGEGDFYFIQILKRRKENPEMDLGVMRIKSYCIYSFKELEDLAPRIKEYCDRDNARAYLRLNKQNATDVTLRCIEQLSKNLREGNPKKGRKVWDSVSGQGGKRNYWVIDVDKEHLEFNPDIIMEIEEMLTLHFSNVRKAEDFEFITNPTKTGVHIITKPFDVRQLYDINKQFQDAHLPIIDINKDGNTLLYYKK